MVIKYKYGWRFWESAQLFLDHFDLAMYRVTVEASSFARIQLTCHNLTSGAMKSQMTSSTMIEPCVVI